MVELTVDGEIIGLYCDGISNLSVGNFTRRDCSRIRVAYFDNPGVMRLDDCAVIGEEECRANNTGGRTCYDTRSVTRVEADFE